MARQSSLWRGHRPAVESADSLDFVRNQILHFGLRVVSILAATLLFFTWVARSTGVAQIPIWPLVPFCLIVWSVTLGERRLPYALRAATLLGVGFLIAAAQLLTLGFGSDARLWFLILTVGGFALFGRTVGALIVMGTSLAVAAFARALASGMPLLVDSAFAAGIQVGEAWWLGWIVFCLLGGLALLGMSRFLNAATRQWRRQRQLMSELEAQRERLREQERDQLAALLASTEISAALSSLLDEQAIATFLVNRLGDALRYDVVQLFLQEDKGPQWRLAASAGSADTSEVDTIDLADLEGIVKQAAEKREAIFVPDVDMDLHFYHRLAHSGKKAAMAVPVMGGTVLVGVIAIGQKEARTLTAKDLLLVRSIAGQLAIALQNARRFQAAQRRAAQTSLINALGRRLEAAGSVENALAQTATALADLLGDATIRVQLTTVTQSGLHGVE